MKNKKGFTIIELIIALMIGTIFAYISSVIIGNMFASWFFVKDQTYDQMEGRTVVKRMIREIRSTRDTTASSIVTFTSREYSFVNVNNTAINFKQNGTYLFRNLDVIASGLDSLNGLNFEYLDSSSEATIDRARIRAVRVTLIIKHGTNQTKFRASGAIRNR